MEFGRLLRQYREAAGLSQEELAGRACMSVRNVGNLERGAPHLPRRETLALLAEALRLSPDEASIFVAAALPTIPVSTPLLQGPKDLPTFPTPLIGRESDVLEVARLLEDGEARLVTLCGPPGVGKTRLAIGAAGRLAQVARFADGVIFVSLASLGEAAEVVGAVTTAVGAQECDGQPPIEALTAHLRTRRILLLLDNFEHVLGAAFVAAEILAACPGVTLLITSRAPLGIRVERVCTVHPLRFADPDHVLDLDKLACVPAVALFVARARAAAPEFSLDTMNARAVAAICRALDGLPLALELAAPRLRAFDAETLLAHLREHPHVLTSGALDLPTRQRTLRDTLAWSHDLLPASAQALFRRFAVFSGGCTLDALLHVCARAEEGMPEATFDDVAILIDHHLLHRTEFAEPRFAMLETIRAYARERLAQSGERETLQQAHADYYASYADIVGAGVTGTEQARWMMLAEADHENFRAVIARSLGDGRPAAALRLAAALWRFWERRSYLSEGRRWLEQLLAATRESAPGSLHGIDADALAALRAKALQGAGGLAVRQSDYPSAIAFHEELLQLSRQRRDGEGEALALNVLGGVAHEQGDNQHAAELWGECLAVRRRIGDRRGVGTVLHNLGAAAYRLGDLGLARVYWEESSQVAQEIGNLSAMATTLNNLGSVDCDEGDYVTAERRFRLCRELCLRLGQQRDLALATQNLAEIVARQGDFAGAEELFREGFAIYAEMGTTFGMIACVEQWASTAHRIMRDLTRAVRLYAAANTARGLIGANRQGGVQEQFERGKDELQRTLGDMAFQVEWTIGAVQSLEDVVEPLLAETVVRQRTLRSVD